MALKSDLESQVAKTCRSQKIAKLLPEEYRPKNQTEMFLLAAE